MSVRKARINGSILFNTLLLALIFSARLPAQTRVVAKDIRRIVLFPLVVNQFPVEEVVHDTLQEAVRFTLARLDSRSQVTGITEQIDSRLLIDLFNSTPDDSPEMLLRENMAELSADFPSGQIVDLQGDFLLVVPDVADYHVESSEEQDYFNIKVQLLIYFRHSGQTEPAAPIRLSAIAAGQTLQEAADSVGRQFGRELVVALRRRLVINAEVLSMVSPEHMIISYGSEMAVTAGDEFYLYSESDGNYGLATIEEVYSRHSLAYLNYSRDDTAVAAGAGLIEFADFGLEAAGYSCLSFDVVGESEIETDTLVSQPTDGFNLLFNGLQIVTKRSFIGFSPLLELALALPLNPATTEKVVAIGNYLPLLYFLGIERRLFLGRFRFTPALSLGSTLLLPVSAGSVRFFSHFAGKIALSASFLLVDRLRLSLNIGYLSMFNLQDNEANKGNIDGLLFGLGFRVR